MSIRMLIDASHREETRVAIVDGNQLEDFDYESSAKKQLKGSIYLAKVTRVEPSLQAAFVDYGGNRHGFLAFSEIHPDYYQIPVADREALIAAEAKANADLLEDDEEEEKPKRRKRRPRKKKEVSKEASSEEVKEEVVSEDKTDTEDKKAAPEKKKEKSSAAKKKADAEDSAEEDKPKPKRRRGRPKSKTKAEATKDAEVIEEEVEAEEETSAEEDNKEDKSSDEEAASDINDEEDDADVEVENSEDKKGTSSEEEEEERLRIRMAKRLRYKYKIQEVIKKNQIILIQVVKEERGNKGAALTTYLSLPGRYCVLMPNTLHGGGVSRKIANVKDRKKLKSVLSSLNMPKGHACIIRTAGSDRTKAEIKRDYDYLKRMWEGIRDLTLKSIAPTQIYEEGNLIKRSIRDLYTRDVGEIIVEGDRGFKTAKDFMGLLMPSHAKKVKKYDDEIPLFQKYRVENLLDSMYSPTAQLKSGGYIVINPTEALVSIDVNSGRATKEHNIEETALKTNLEAAEEVARQLKLRDMAGLVVIDFIDMEEQRNNRAVERKMKACLKSDRARIQVGRISSFGLMEMSRQRLRVGVLESSTDTCPHCEGSGLLRSVESQSLNILRIIEEEGIKAKNSKFVVYLPSKVAVYILNNKRTSLLELEKRYDFSVAIEIDDELTASAYRMDKSGKPSWSARKKKDTRRSNRDVNKTSDSDDDNSTSSGENKDRPRRRRRRRRGSHNNNNNNNVSSENSENSENEVAEKQAASDNNNERGNRRRRPRRSRKPSQETDNKAETGDNQNVEPTADANEKPKARKERGKKSEEVEKVTEDAVKSAPEDKKEEEKPKRKRRTSSRKKSEDTGDKSDTDKSDSDKKTEEKPKKPARKRAAKKEKAEEADTKPVAEKAKSDKPKKKGWWSR